MDSVIRGVAVYVLVLAGLRAAGRRSVGEMTGFDLVLLLIVAETTQQALLGDDFSITNSVVLLATLFGIDILLSFVKQRWPAAERALDGRPTVLMLDGQIDEAALRQTRIDRDDLMEAARREGLPNLRAVRHAVLEINGEISIIPEKAVAGNDE
jgi:uncharacterized membrane protein YcaP (DUF421 family)